MFHVSMDYIILVNVLKSDCYLLYYTLCPVLWQHFNLMNTQVVHEVTSFRQFGHDVCMLTLSEGFNQRDYIFAVLTLEHSVDFADVILFFQLAVL